MRSLLFLPCLFFAINVMGQIDHWETIVYAENEWSYELGNPGIDSEWNQLSFDDSDWALGNGSIGYGDNDDNTTISNTVSVFMRHKFIIVDKSNDSIHSEPTRKSYASSSYKSEAAAKAGITRTVKFYDKAKAQVAEVVAEGKEEFYAPMYKIIQRKIICTSTQM